MKYKDINLEERECQSIEPDPGFPGYMRVNFVSKRRAGFVHSEWYKTSDFVLNNPDLAHLADNTPRTPKDEVGVVTSATKLSLTDKRKQWHENEFDGYNVWISRGKGEGQTRKITKNTTDTLFVAKSFKQVPDLTSQYLITFNVHDPQVLGNTLPATFNLKEKVKPKKRGKS